MALIGWLEWVEETETGVNVHFSQKRTVRYQLADGGREQSLGGAAGIACFPAALGDKFHSHNTPEDGCNYEVVADNGTIGLKAAAYFKGGHHAVFIPAIDALPPSGSPPCMTISRSFRPFWGTGPIGPAVPVEEK